MRIISWIGLLGAFILTACTSHHQKHLLGYVEGRYVYLSSPVSGQLVQLSVRKGERVSANQLAFQLDPQPESSQLQAAQADLLSAQHDLENLKIGERETIIKRLTAQIAQAQATVEYSKKMYTRNADLVKTGAVSKSQFDQSLSQYHSDLENLHTMQANMAEAKLGARTNVIYSQEAKVQASQNKVREYQWLVAQKTVRFAQAGFIQDTLFRQNEFVPAGKPVIQFLPPQNRILIFFVPEKELSRIKAGEQITYTCDECNQDYHATIDYISSQAEYTPPVIYSKDSREKLVYWIEAAIDPAIAEKMNPGQPVEVTIP